MSELEFIATKVLHGEMTEEEGAKLITAILYKEKAWFKLQVLDKDHLHDFLLEIQRHLIRVFLVYDPELGTFPSFLYVVIQRLLQAYMRQLANEAAIEESLAMMNKVTIEEKNYRYQTEEPELMCEAAFDREEEKQFSASIVQSNASTIFNFSHTPSSHGRYSAHDEKKENLRRAACLILALKSSIFLTDELIHKVGIVTGIDEQSLLDMVAQAKESMGSKLKKWERSRNCRDSAFFYHRKYLIEFLKLSKNCHLAQEKLKKFEIQTQLWKSKLAQLSNPENTPSRKTCERIGCELESIVPVPSPYRAVCAGAEYKCRYILIVPEKA